MIITIRLFAGARDRAGADQIEIRVTPPVRIGELQQALLNHCPGLSAFGNSLLWAVNNRYATSDQLVRSSDSVACFPPVSGG